MLFGNVSYERPLEFLQVTLAILPFRGSDSSVMLIERGWTLVASLDDSELLDRPSLRLVGI